MAADLRICRRCGHEGESEAAACAHCGEKLPALEPKGGDESLSEKDAKPTAVETRLDPALVTEDLKQGQAQLAQGRHDTARLFFRNALALDLLTEPDDKGRSGIIGQWIQKCDFGRAIVRVPCSSCDGTGRRMVSSAVLNGREVQVGGGGAPCPRCGGSGSVSRSGSVADRKFALGRSLREYRTLQQSRRYVPVGEAWVPEAVEPTLSLRMRVALRRFAAAPCADCLGIGKADCQTCSGTGRVKCSNRGCVSGMVTAKPANTLGRSLERQEKCKICSGSAVIPCEKCRGGGNVLCRRCNGTGERSLCARCSGEGLSPCQRCAGTGNSRGASCTACGGSGEVFCANCRGDGRNR